MILDTLIDRRLLPDWALRLGIRRQLQARLRREDAGDAASNRGRLQRRMRALREMPITVQPEAANAQHYELPATFFAAVLGPYLKYSCGLWLPGTTGLAQAEEAMLALSAERAGIEDGMRVLDLGCGWGSFTRYIARHYPRCRVLAVSNSHSQRRYIESFVRDEGHPGVRVRTQDVALFRPGERFDRIVSVEMLEHVSNYEALFERLADWLDPAGCLFVHVFVHRLFAYPFEEGAQGSWMGRHFFTGGQMPSDDLLPSLGGRLALESRWRVGGEHYARTAQAWLARLDARQDELAAHLDGVAAGVSGRALLNRWRVFLLACEEMWGYRGGSEWHVSHYRFRARAACKNERARAD